MAYVPIPKDLSRVKTKVAFNLTRRQLIGYTLAVLVMGVIRELFGSGTLLGVQILPDAIPKIGVLVAPAGAFITLGYFIALFKHLVNKKMA